MTVVALLSNMNNPECFPDLLQFFFKLHGSPPFRKTPTSYNYILKPKCKGNCLVAMKIFQNRK